MATLSSTGLARRCGVSQGTVDRALHGRPDIAEATRKRILAEAAKLGYVPHHGARALISGSHHLIGLILFGIDNHFTARMIRSIEEAARAAGYELLVAFSNRDPELERRYLRRFLERRVDGVIVFPVTKTSEELKLAEKQKVPVVALFNGLDSTQANFLRIDEAKAMGSLAQRLAARGCRRVAFVTYPTEPGQNVDAVELRRESFLSSARACGLKVEVVMADSLPSQWDNFEVVVCHNDRLATGILREIRKRSSTRPMPQVTGFDAADELDRNESIAATFAVPYDAIARQAVKLIQKRKFKTTRQFAAQPQWNHL